LRGRGSWGYAKGENMARIKDKTVGTMKEIAGEILGDGKLAEEGHDQKNRPDGSDGNKPRPLGPLEHLKNLS